MSGKRLILILVCAAAVLCTGCDAFRRLAGRPTSDVIEARRAAVEAAREAQHKAHMDSLAKVEKQLADSLAVMDSLKAMNGTMQGPKSMGGLESGALAHRYYLVLGSFMDEGNAAYQKARAEKAGYEVTMITFRNGYRAVGVCASDSIVESYENLKKVKMEKFCPADVWILVN